MKITIHHRAHWEWVFPAPGETIAEGEHVMPISDQAPHIVKVRRLQTAAATTVMGIPDASVARMAQDRAVAAAGGQQAVVKRSHLHQAISLHIQDVIHHHHAPIDGWLRIEVDGDKALEKYLNAVHVHGNDGQEALQGNRNG